MPVLAEIQKGELKETLGRFFAGFMERGFEIQREKKALIIRFNRPYIRNPLGAETLNCLHKVLDEFQGTVIFTGSEDVFASGADLKQIADLTPSQAFEFASLGQDLMKKIRSRDSISAINGLCFGGAFDLSLNCKRRIASDKAKFSHPGVMLGIMTAWSGTQILPKVVGKKKALEILLTGKVINAQEALEMGIVEKLVEKPLDFVIETLL